MVKVLVTGVTGQVGRALMKVHKEAARSPYEVIPCYPPDAEEVFGPGPTMDLEDPDSIEEVLNDTEPDYVLNPAAYTAVDKAEEDSELAFAVNANAPGIIARSLKKWRGKLVHYSTDYVYGRSDTTPIHEEDVTDPQGVYARSKYAGDAAILRSGLPAIIFRTSWVYGEGDNFVKKMIQLGMDRESLSVVNDQIGAPTYANTIARATWHVLDLGLNERNLWRGKVGVVHLTDAGETSWFGFAQEIFARARNKGVDLKLRSLSPVGSDAYPTPAPRPLNSRMALDRLRQWYGFEPPAWQVSLAHYMEEIL